MSPHARRGEYPSSRVSDPARAGVLVELPRPVLMHLDARDPQRRSERAECRAEFGEPARKSEQEIGGGNESARGVVALAFSSAPRRYRQANFFDWLSDHFESR
jgi:hypothetical protein